jgi:hypothetical protein
MSPDRALKETVEWKPTVTRKPRMDAQLRLDINRLKSQKEEMKRNSEGEAHIVYGYLRAKDSGTGKAGSPYYIGIGNSYARAFNKNHAVPLPKNEALIRQLGVFKTRAEAAAREQALIAQYGRKGMDPGGTLLNRSAGGDASGYGSRRTEQQKRNIRNAKLAQAAKAAGVPLDIYSSLTTRQRAAMTTWRIKNPGQSAMDWIKLNQKQGGARGAYSARKVATKAQELGIDADLYASLTQSERHNFASWRNRNPGKSIESYLAAKQSGLQPRELQSAAKFGIAPDAWSKLSVDHRRVVGLRYRRGKRGDDLLKHLDGDSEISPRDKAMASKYGIEIDKWLSLPNAQRRLVTSRYSRGVRDDALLKNLNGDEIDSRFITMAKRYGITPEKWMSLSPVQRKRVGARYAAGKRGAALLEGLI